MAENFSARSAIVSQQPNTTLDRNNNLKRKRHCKIWRFSWPKPGWLEPLLKITRGTKKHYIVIEPVWPPTKLWTNTSRFASHVSRSRIMVPFASWCKPRLVFSRTIGPGPVLSKWKRVLFDLITHFVYSIHFISFNLAPYWQDLLTIVTYKENIH